MTFTTGKTLKNGTYRLEETLRQDGLSITYRATRSQRVQAVVVKTLKLGGFTQADFIGLKQRFLDDAQAFAQCLHPGLVRVLDIFEEEGLPYVVMDYIPGRSLAKQVEQNGPLHEKVALQYLQQIASAVQALHQRGLVHAHITPNNMVQPPGANFVVLVDCGRVAHPVSEAQAMAMSAMNNSFAALEQYRPNSRLSPATDVYSLAASLYWLLTGKLPSPAHLRQKAPLLAPRQVNPSISPQVEASILAGLELSPQIRPNAIPLWFNGLRKRSNTGVPSTGAPSTGAPSTGKPSGATGPSSGPVVVGGTNSGFPKSPLPVTPISPAAPAQASTQAPTQTPNQVPPARPPARPGTSQPGTSQPGTSQPAVSQPGTSQLSPSRPSTAQPGASPGISKPGTAQPGTAQPGTAQPSPSQPPPPRPSSPRPVTSPPGGKASEPQSPKAVAASAKPALGAAAIAATAPILPATAPPPVHLAASPVPGGRLESPTVAAHAATLLAPPAQQPLAPGLPRSAPGSDRPWWRKLIKLGAIAALAGFSFGFGLRLRSSSGPGSSFFHVEQAFPPIGKWPVAAQSVDPPEPPAPAQGRNQPYIEPAAADGAPPVEEPPPRRRGRSEGAGYDPGPASDAPSRTVDRPGSTSSGSTSPEPAAPTTPVAPESLPPVEPAAPAPAPPDSALPPDESAPAPVEPAAPNWEPAPPPAQKTGPSP